MGNFQSTSFLLPFSFILSLSSCSSCSRASSGAAEAGAAPVASEAAEVGAPMDPREAELWQRAGGGEGDDLARLVDYEGCVGVVERGRDDASLRPTAVRAVAYCRDMVALPWLAEVGQDGPDADALAALDSAVELAAQPRRAVDPDDAPELRDGCDRLMGLAKDTARPKERRIVAIRALRMLADRGCVDRAAIPTDLDAH
jgi:hypothetical protein